MSTEPETPPMPPGAEPCPSCHGAGGTFSGPCSDCRGEGRVLAEVVHRVQVYIDTDQFSSRLVCERPARCASGFYDRSKSAWDCYVVTGYADLGQETLDFPAHVQPLVGAVPVIPSWENGGEELYLRPTPGQQAEFADALRKTEEPHRSHTYETEVGRRTLRLWCRGKREA